MGARGPLPDRRRLKVVGPDATHRPPPASRKPKPRPIRPHKPPWLDDFAARVWDRMVRELEPLGMLNPTTREVLAAYCEAASVNHAAYRALTPSKRRGPDVLSKGRHDDDPLVRAKA